MIHKVQNRVYSLNHGLPVPYKVGKKVHFLKPCVTSDPQNREKKLILQKPWQSIDPQSKGKAIKKNTSRRLKFDKK